MAKLDLDFRPKPPGPPPRMTPAHYRRALFKHARIRLYIIFATILTLSAVLTFGFTLPMLAGMAATILAFPFVEYAVHRFVFHNRLLYRFPLTARFWRYVHYSHHMNPNDPSQVIGPPQFMAPTALAISLPLGWLVGGPPGAGAAVATSIWLLVVYEYFHGASHLVAEPGTGYGRLLRRMHMLHHFHNETGDFGVTSPLADIVFGTFYLDPTKKPRSETTHNLGYTAEVAKRFPWAGQDGALTPPRQR